MSAIALGLRNLRSFPIGHIADQIIRVLLEKIINQYHPITLSLSGWDLRKGHHDPEGLLAGWYESDLEEGIEDRADYTINFFADRLKVQQREAGVRHDLIDAVFALGGEDDLVRLLARVRALQAFVETPAGADLLAGYKRAANILKKEGWGSSVTPANAGVSGSEGAPSSPEIPASAGMTNNSLSYTPEPAETALMQALDSAEPEAAAAVEREDFAGAMTALATLRAPVDAFFNEVTVNDPDPARRAARLNLLARMRSAVHRVADFSRIEG